MDTDLLILFMILNIVGFTYIFILTGRYLRRTIYWLIVGNIGFWLFFISGQMHLLNYDLFLFSEKFFYWIILLSVLGIGYLFEKYFVKEREPLSKPQYNTSVTLPEENRIYNLPLYAVSKIKWYVHVIFGFLEVILLADLYTTDSSDSLLMKVIPVTLFIIISLLWSMNGIISKPYIKMTDDYLEYKSSFSRKSVRWDEILKVEFFIINGVTNLGIVINRQYKSISQQLDEMLGYNYYIRIPVSMFSNIDFKKLKATILSKSTS